MRMDELAAPAIEAVDERARADPPRGRSRAATSSGWRTSARGASAASCGGATRSPSGTAATTRPTSGWSRRRATAGSATPTCSTRGSRSALWPFATLGWPEETPDLRAFYPTDVLSTARDILFLWVARMVMMGLRFAGDIPFDRRLRALGHPGARRAADEQVARHRHRPARGDRPARRRRGALRPAGDVVARRTCATPPRRSSRARRWPTSSSTPRASC